jgi:hypothetical protein
MQTIDVFWYKNILEVQVQDPAIFTTRNRIVYSRPIKIYQGIDNPIHIVAKNQDQKSVDLTGYTMEIAIQDIINELTVSVFAVSAFTWTRGLGQFTIPVETVNALDQEFYWLTARLVNTATNMLQPLYIDDNHEVRLTLQVLPAYYQSVSQDLELNDGIIDEGVI